MPFLWNGAGYIHISPATPVSRGASGTRTAPAHLSASHIHRLLPTRLLQMSASPCGATITGISLSAKFRARITLSHAECKAVRQMNVFAVAEGYETPVHKKAAICAPSKALWQP